MHSRGPEMFIAERYQLIFDGSFAGT
jgi:hypothetical protein